jgi:DNA-binding NtrC family response regulator
MPRGAGTSRSRRVAQPSVGGFRWDAPWLATIIHSHVPPVAGHPDTRLVRPLQECLPAPKRDVLSLVGQFAAHLAFLRFAGIGNSALELSQWGIIKERGRDPRLVRREADRVTESDEMLPVTLIEQFCEALGAPRLEVLRHGWVRPEAVYAEVLERLESVPGDTTWLRQSSWGVVRSPGPEILQELLTRSGITVLADQDAILSARALGDAIAILGGEANPLEPWSAVREIIPDQSDPESETALAETLLGQGPRVFVVENWRAFDAASRRFVRVLINAGDPLSWILSRELESMVPAYRQPIAGEPTRRYLLSTSIAAGHDLLATIEARSAPEFARWCTEFCSSPDFVAFVREGRLPPLTSISALEGVEEPIRSFARALAMLGMSFPPRAGESMLASLGFPDRLEDVVATGAVIRRDEQTLEFASSSARDELIAELAQPLRASLALLAADLPGISVDPMRRIALLVDAGRLAQADEEAIALRGAVADASLAVRTLPRTTAAILGGCHHVAALRCRALIDLGRYADAAREAESIPGSCGRLVRALILRRLGDYRAALDTLGPVGENDHCSFEENLLSGELHRLQGHLDAADDAFRRARSRIRDATDRGRLAYERAILEFDRGMQGPEDELPDNPYYESRYLFYEAAGVGNLSSAIGHAKGAIRRAATIPEKVDAELDLVFALFLAGDWDAARLEARAALVTLEETQGDRAAAGILFTLAFLCADDGQWMQAEQKIARLQNFYDEREDERRARELDLLRAHLALCRLETPEAERLAESLLGERLSSEMREAAALILDEIAWMKGELIAPRSSGESQCVELTNRHLVFVARTSRVTQHEIQNRFWASLCRWESARFRGDDVEPPSPASRTEQLILLRSMVALHARKPGARLAGWIDELATAVGLPSPLRAGIAGAPDHELAVLRLAATEPYPFEPHALGVPWRIVSRTRTDRWNQSGPLPPIDPAEAERILRDAPPDWVRCGIRTLVWLDGLDRWSQESRAALAAVIEMRIENANLRRLVSSETPPAVIVRPDGVIGESQAIRDALSRIEPASRRDVAVCIEGESGTGKELIARAIHERSSRRARPFTAVNCAALPENLIETELFGCVRGAFTGADRDRKGLVEATDEGTLFLDEIAEMALPAQAKLLRFLQEREFRRVGETINRRADVRVIAATNRRLEQAVDRGEFRDDLYYRICGIEISVPPLRERGTDVLLLARHFLRAEVERHGIGPSSISEEVEEILLSHGWPGNVRELQQAIRAAHAIAGDARVVAPEHLPERMCGAPRRKIPTGSLAEEVSRFRRDIIERALDTAAGNQSRAAKQLGVTRQALAYQIRELGILVEKPR